MLRTKTGQLILSALAIAAYLLATAVDAAPARTAISLVGGGGGDYVGTLGFGFYGAGESGFSVYLNGHTSMTGDQEPMYESLGPAAFGDPLTGREQNLTLFNGGATWALNQNVALYGGVGYASVEGVARKEDPMQILASDGEYWVRDPANDDSGANFNLGLIAGGDTVVLDLGCDTFPGRVYLGIGVRF